MNRGSGGVTILHYEPLHVIRVVTARDRHGFCYRYECPCGHHGKWYIEWGRAKWTGDRHVRVVHRKRPAGDWPR